MTPAIAICNQQPYATVFPRIDAVITRANQFQAPGLAGAINQRRNRVPNFQLSDSDVLRTCIELIASSEGAKALAVTKLINTGVFHQVFTGYNVANVADLNPAQVCNQHWNQLGVIRFPTKITAMIGCAKALLQLRQGHPSFMNYLSKLKLPSAVLGSESDVGQFWSGFQAAQSEFKRVKMPFYDQLTSLCHLLMMLGFECAKPDRVVVGTAVRLGIVPSARNPLKPTYSVKTRRKVIFEEKIVSHTRGHRE